MKYLVPGAICTFGIIGEGGYNVTIAQANEWYVEYVDPTGLHYLRRTDSSWVLRPTGGSAPVESLFKVGARFTFDTVDYHTITGIDGPWIEVEDGNGNRKSATDAVFGYLTT